MRLGKLQASGYVADVADDDARDEVTIETPRETVPEPVGQEREQVAVSG